MIQKLRNLSRVTIIVLCFATAMEAGIIAGSSNYGVNFNAPEACTTTATTFVNSYSFSCNTGSATVTAEAFTASTNSDLVIFDFQVTDAPGDYNLTLTSTGAPINSADDLGLFTCNPSAPPQCSNDLPLGVTLTSNYGTLVDSNDASFPVTGASSADTFVFFVALDDPNAAAANVTATLTPTSGAPEPATLPLAGGSLIALIWFLRRQRLRG